LIIAYYGKQEKPIFLCDINSLDVSKKWRYVDVNEAGDMSKIKKEMKEVADYAIKAGKERFGQELDFSEQSIDKLENLLDQAYQTFSNFTKDKKTSDSLTITAYIWGSYLGEFMRLKWGGRWILKSSERLIYIKKYRFSPIRFVYQKITSHPEISVKYYLFRVERILRG
jgi:hypothetical protein